MEQDNQTSNGKGMRLDVFIMTYIAKAAEQSRAVAAEYIKQGRVTVNGRVIIKPSAQVQITDEVVVDWPEATDKTIAIKDFLADSKHIIYCDNNVAVINKPAGMLTHNIKPNDPELSIADIARYLYDSTEASQYSTYDTRLGIVHRLDRRTSGLLIVARNDHATKILANNFAFHKAKKTYFAICSGTMARDKFIIDMPIARNRRTSGAIFTVNNRDGKQAITRCTKEADYGDNYVLMKLQPITGRTHQLRVHMAAIDCPIVGDDIYNPQYLKRYDQPLLLHATKLEITIPGDSMDDSNQRKTFIAPLPDSFKEFIKRCQG